MWRKTLDNLRGSDKEIPWDKLRELYEAEKKSRDSLQARKVAQNFAYGRQRDKFVRFLQKLDLAKLDPMAEQVKISFCNPQGKLRKLAVAELLYKAQPSIKAAVEAGIYDAVLIQPIEKDEPLLLFKKLGQTVFQLDVFGGGDTLFWRLNQGVVLWKGEATLPSGFKGYTADAIEVPIQLFTDYRFGLKNTPMIKQVKSIFRKLGIIKEARGGVRNQRDEELEQRILRICMRYFEKHKDLPPSEYVSKKLEKSLRYENIGGTRIFNYINKLAPQIISSNLLSQNTFRIPTKK